MAFDLPHFITCHGKKMRRQLIEICLRKVCTEYYSDYSVCSDVYATEEICSFLELFYLIPLRNAKRHFELLLKLQCSQCKHQLSNNYYGPH